MSPNFFETCFFFFLSLVFFPSLPSSSHFSLLDNSRSLSLPSRGYPQLDFPRFVYFLLQSLALHLRVSAVARFLLTDFTSHDSGNLVRAFFTAERIFATRKSGFLSDSHFAFHSPWIKVSSRSFVSSTFHFSHSSYFSAYLSSFLPAFLILFYRCVLLRSSVRYQFAD